MVHVSVQVVSSNVKHVLLSHGVISVIYFVITLYIKFTLCFLIPYMSPYIVADGYPSTKLCRMLRRLVSILRSVEW
jgi:hypothetical protein